MTVASPLGWTPSPDGTGIAPAYPLGAPALMALFTLLGGPDAVFFVAPVAGLVTLLLVYRLARLWYDRDTALFAAALAAWNPLLIAYAKQPMSDVFATMWMTLALLLALRSIDADSGRCRTRGRHAAIITRPALLIAAALVPFLARGGDGPSSLAGLALVIGVIVQAAIQRHLFGSPFSTGYGTASVLFSVEHVATNAGIFAKHLWTIGGPLWIVGLALGVIAARPAPRAMPLMILATVAAPYLSTSRSTIGKRCATSCRASCR